VKKSKFAFILTLLAAIGGGWYFLKHFDLKGLEGLALAPRASSTSGTEFYTAPPVQRTGETVRVASFNIQVFGDTKAQKPHVMEKLAAIVRSFDIIAIQEVRTRDDGHLPRFVDMINATGRRYDFVIGPRLGRSVSTEQYAFIFDTQSVEIDRRQLYTVEDPDDLLHREPLVGWFRVRGPDPSQAFTFTLVNIHTDPDETDKELDVLAQVFVKVQHDGRGEDDVIILGDFNVDDRHLGELGRLPNITWCISGVPTNVRGTQLYDNLVFSKRATVEFTGRAGVYDFMREFNLSQDEAVEISDHIPVWAEFSLYEGGVPGRVAVLP
jgi:endonuclease/exonuclease/phosphatase family metal-dependent hydrolase